MLDSSDSDFEGILKEFLKNVDVERQFKYDSDMIVLKATITKKDVESCKYMHELSFIYPRQ